MEARLVPVCSILSLYVKSETILLFPTFLLVALSMFFVETRIVHPYWMVALILDFIRHAIHKTKRENVISQILS